MDTRYTKLRELAALQAARKATSQEVTPTPTGTSSIAGAAEQLGPRRMKYLAGLRRQFE
jgi:hypothetical protein